MSTRTLLEFNHDYVERLLEDPQELQRLRLALSMGCGRQYPLPTGVTFLGQRHHSDPPFLFYDQQRDIQHQLERLRAGKRLVTKTEGPAQNSCQEKS